MKALRRRLAPAVVLLAMGVTTGCSDPPPCTLCEAIDRRDVAAVQALVARGEPVSRDALERAIEPRGLDQRTGARLEPRDRRIAELLLARGDANARWTVTRSGRGSQQTQRHLGAALLTAWPDAAAVALLLQRGLDAKGEPGGEALRAAAERGGRDAVQALLATGAPVNHAGPDGKGMTALAHAIQRRDLPMIDALERAGALEWPDR